jgi:hypothetical protein
MKYFNDPDILGRDTAGFKCLNMKAMDPDPDSQIKLQTVEKSYLIKLDVFLCQRQAMETFCGIMCVPNGLSLSDDRQDNLKYLTFGFSMTR